jgi:poly-gamma-glutamate capsule biosynthesis protein CapA/YwtB (metallophosphatase superfamily)
MASNQQAPNSKLAISRRAFLAALGTGLLAGCSSEESTAGTKASSREQVTVYDDEAPEQTTVTFAMVGDILVHTAVWQSGVAADGTRNYDHLFANVKADVESYDIAALDQETILGGESFGFSGYPSFNSPQEFADAEVAAGFDVFLHANNHAIDQGLAGIQSELSYWREHYPDAVVTGMADTEEAAATIPIIERSGHKIAVLNYAADTNGIPLPSDAPWCVRMLTEEQVTSDFAAAQEAGAEAIAVCPHWGEEYAAEPNEFQRNWANRFVELGATVIFGNHPHVMQPVEALVGDDGRLVPVYWSLGNFVSTMVGEQSMIGGLAHVAITFTGDAMSVTAAGLTPLVTHKIYGPGITTYKLADYTEELASANAIRNDSGNGDFSRQWCVDFCAGRLGDGFDATTCEYTLAL